MVQNQQSSDTIKDFLDIWQKQFANSDNFTKIQNDNLVEKIFAGWNNLSGATYKRKLDWANEIWSEGSTRLFDYSPDKKNNSPIILFVPSLVNRSYILDLTEETSLTRYLANENIVTYLLDWGSPQENELSMGVEDYVNRLQKVVKFLNNQHNRPIILAGYCMGGILSLAVAQELSDMVEKIVFIATPWNFDVQDFKHIKFTNDISKAIEKSWDSLPYISADVIKAWFCSNYPDLIARKFMRFVDLQIGSAEYEHALAIEEWSNNGVPLTISVSKTCFIDWINDNKLYKEQWLVNGKKLEPKKLKQPCFFAIAQRDCIVPPDCTNSLAQMVQISTIIRPDTGHTGMVAGMKGREKLWEPLLSWIKN
ncbi:alpha/beta fold hydrolase [Rickettsiales bacterium]|nr:alpha/beta fold hydrolase [Rickettsiales bacterium]